jgi:hypothetical protein
VYRSRMRHRTLRSRITGETSLLPIGSCVMEDCNQSTKILHKRYTPLSVTSEKHQFADVGGQISQM